MERNVLRQGKEMLMPNAKRRWSPVVVLLMVNAGLWGSSCIYANDFDPWTLKGREPAECQGVGDDGPCAILAGPCGIGKCNTERLCELTSAEMPMVPPSANPCIQAQCVSGQLVEQPLSDGSPCTLEGGSPEAQTFCLSGQCSGECFSAMDCKGEQAYCFNYHCATCTDNLTNGDETEADCGGHCKKCLGEPCADSSECANGHCVDGVCCNSNCDVECRACNVSGKEGTCSDVPFLGLDDNPGSNNDCISMDRCDGQGNCKTALNVGCSSSSDCASGYCLLDPGGAICKLNENAPCSKADEQDCFSGFCGDMNTCKKAPKDYPCFGDFQCANGVCNGGKCN